METIDNPTPGTQTDPPPSPWLRQFFANLRYVWMAASVWIFAVIGILEAIELAQPDLLGPIWGKVAILCLVGLGPIAKAAPQDIPKPTMKASS